MNRSIMNRILPLITFLLGFGLSGTALAELVVEDAYVRGLPPGVANTSAYMMLINTGDEPLVLTGGSSPIAGSVTLHSTMNHNGMLHMTHQDSATIPARGQLLLESGGMHLMLSELTANPAVGEEVELTLRFADGMEHTFAVPVRSVLDE